ncbi:hypothetical protein ASPWEDRAFT_23836 [Aspergillus wentii DTO 134E9]|uniref:FAD dependent oxidoreductase domain-containing protein n=1 Tax=Aspergillus wentii DTO 134E9 TaxID=1073089 RepID=A0A1L9S3P2_ASPWE|nr:uncharacterized protein ASPWEDRAFT_23836 [Aspergillus wentii DTO 134E9]KAI9930111.1 hypothetical protein MW887_011921 [Aspergillus wentii]OJJ41774.1 hypothetical protein ASPWEDRAFT_23836 [Aspergillus wentii DTO 134E9]
MATPSKTATILIIGGGVFGLSTALELSNRGYKDITVLDRHLPPVPDGSSVDISRIIRPDYADEFYARMGLDALRGWTNEYTEFFHRSGLLCVQSQGSTRHTYLEQSKQNLSRLGESMTIQTFQGNEIMHRHPGIHGDLTHTSGYINVNCGWADAEGSIAHLARLCTRAGVSFIAGKNGTVTDLVTQAIQGKKKKITGVRTLSGRSISADMVILATGAWTSHLIEMGNRTISTGQPVGFMKLTEREAYQMKDCPVMIDLSTGFFVFPPTPGSHILKMARHGYGYETRHSSSSVHHSNRSFSGPDISSQRQFLPSDAEHSLRDGLALFLPKFKDRIFSQRRLCWYTDTPKGDFIVDHHPEYENLFLATGGSGHAFKFLPVLGRHIVDNFEGKASEEQRQKWAWKEVASPIHKGDGSRGGPPRRALSREEQAHL